MLGNQKKKKEEYVYKKKFKGEIFTLSPQNYNPLGDK